MFTLCATLSILCLMLAGFLAVDGVQCGTRKVGGLRFVKVGRLTVSYSVTRGAYRPLKQAMPTRGAR